MLINNNYSTVLSSCIVLPAKFPLGGLALGEEAPIRPVVSGTEALAAQAQWQDQTSQRPQGLL